MDEDYPLNDLNTNLQQNEEFGKMDEDYPLLNQNVLNRNAQRNEEDINIGLLSTFGDYGEEYDFYRDISVTFRSERMSESNSVSEKVKEESVIIPSTESNPLALDTFASSTYSSISPYTQTQNYAGTSAENHVKIKNEPGQYLSYNFGNNLHQTSSSQYHTLTPKAEKDDKKSVNTSFWNGMSTFYDSMDTVNSIVKIKKENGTVEGGNTSPEVYDDIQYIGTYPRQDLSSNSSDDETSINPIHSPQHPMLQKCKIGSEISSLDGQRNNFLGRNNSHVEFRQDLSFPGDCQTNNATPNCYFKELNNLSPQASGKCQNSDNFLPHEKGNKNILCSDFKMPESHSYDLQFNNASSAENAYTLLQNIDHSNGKKSEMNLINNTTPNYFFREENNLSTKNNIPSKYQKSDNVSLHKKGSKNIFDSNFRMGDSHRHDLQLNNASSAENTYTPLQNIGHNNGKKSEMNLISNVIPDCYFKEKNNLSTKMKIPRKYKKSDNVSLHKKGSENILGSNFRMESSHKHDLQLNNASSTENAHPPLQNIGHNNGKKCEMNVTSKEENNLSIKKKRTPRKYKKSGDVSLHKKDGKNILDSNFRMENSHKHDLQLNNASSTKNAYPPFQNVSHDNCKKSEMNLINNVSPNYYFREENNLSTKKTIPGKYKKSNTVSLHKKDSKNILDSNLQMEDSYKHDVQLSNASSTENAYTYLQNISYNNSKKSEMDLINNVTPNYYFKEVNNLSTKKTTPGKYKKSNNVSQYKKDGKNILDSNFRMEDSHKHDLQLNNALSAEKAYSPLQNIGHNNGRKSEMDNNVTPNYYLKKANKLPIDISGKTKISDSFRPYKISSRNILGSDFQMEYSHSHDLQLNNASSAENAMKFHQNIDDNNDKKSEPEESSIISTNVKHLNGSDVNKPESLSAPSVFNECRYLQQAISELFPTQTLRPDIEVCEDGHNSSLNKTSSSKTVMEQNIVHNNSSKKPEISDKPVCSIDDNSLNANDKKNLKSDVVSEHQYVQQDMPVLYPESYHPQLEEKEAKRKEFIQNGCDSKQALEYHGIKKERKNHPLDETPDYLRSNESEVFNFTIPKLKDERFTQFDAEMPKLLPNSVTKLEEPDKISSRVEETVKSHHLSRQSGSQNCDMSVIGNGKQSNLHVDLTQSHPEQPMGQCKSNTSDSLKVSSELKGNKCDIPFNKFILPWVRKDAVTSVSKRDDSKEMDVATETSTCNQMAELSTNVTESPCIHVDKFSQPDELEICSFPPIERKVMDFNQEDMCSENRGNELQNYTPPPSEPEVLRLPSEAPCMLSDKLTQPVLETYTPPPSERNVVDSRQEDVCSESGSITQLNDSYTDNVESSCTLSEKCDQNLNLKQNTPPSSERETVDSRQEDACKGDKILSSDQKTEISIQTLKFTAENMLPWVVLEKYVPPLNKGIVVCSSQKVACYETASCNQMTSTDTNIEETFSKTSKLNVSKEKKKICSTGDVLGKPQKCIQYSPKKKRKTSERNSSSKKRKIQFECQHCEKIYVREHFFIKHIQTHANKRSQCEECGKYFATKSALASHSKIHMVKNTFSCEACQKTYVRRCNYEKHLKTHITIKLFLCILCDMAFRKKIDRNSHLQDH